MRNSTRHYFRRDVNAFSLHWSADSRADYFTTGKIFRRVSGLRTAAIRCSSRC
jgi:hypothetical protein